MQRVTAALTAALALSTADAGRLGAPATPGVTPTATAVAQDLVPGAGDARALAADAVGAPAMPARRALAQASDGAPPPAPVSGFVKRNNATFLLDSGPGGEKVFYVTGGNQYALMMTATWDWEGVESALDEAASLGLNVLRTWAFGERPANGNPKTPALQTAPGQYDEDMFQALDRVVFEAGRRGLRLLLALANNWDAYGGAPAYMSWAAASGEAVPSVTAPDASPFFSSPFCMAAYKAHVATVLNRVNTLTGVAYKDEPAIFGFDLINEPRVPADPSGDTLQAWTEEMAAHFKSIDSNHLLTTGAEGFYGASTPALLADNPAGDSSNGVDFVRNHLVDDIDFATIHVWPDQWLQCCTADCLLPFLRQWLQGHIDAAGAINKPLLVEEFGAKMRCEPGGESGSSGSSAQYPGASAGRRMLADPPSPAPPPAPSQQLLLRTEMYHMIYSNGHAAAKAGQAFGGSLFWLLGINGQPDADQYSVYLPQDTETAALIAEHVSSMRLLDTAPIVTAVAADDGGAP